MLSRRDLLRRTGMGFGSLALATLLADEGRLTAAGGRIDPRKLRGKARSVILLFMGGGPSQVDTFDPKPLLTRLNGKDVPESIARGVPRVARQRLKNLHASPWQFRQHGHSGLWVSELFPHLARRADELCVIRSMHHTIPVHPAAEYLATTGTSLGVRPSLGAWLHYGLGSASRDLPGFVVLLADENYGGSPCWGHGFLPSRHQGTVVTAAGVRHARPPDDSSPSQRRKVLDALAELNRLHLERVGGDSELEARLASFELAHRMQTSAPEAFDLSREPDRVRALYGVDRPECAAYARHCLLARRLVERGVRFVQLNHGGWDAHSNLKGNHQSYARKTDRPIAGLLCDLKQRGLLDSTLVVWGGEFGRTPTAEGSGTRVGRDHAPGGYTVWLAGGGVKGGQAIGATDEVGYSAVERPVSPADLHATVLHAFGIDQRELYYEHHNRREIVTVNGGRVVREAFA